jgi:S-DNA-T family DNA segregation ATPase FtsK/SpoIIIE
MAKSKSNHNPWWKRLLIFLVTRVLLLVVIAGLVYWQWSHITSWVNHTTTGVFQLFGFGLVLVILAILMIVEVSLTKPIWFLRHWNKWIGGFVIAAAVWGTLAFFKGSGVLSDVTVGGRIGLSIVGNPGLLGGFIVFVLYIAGAFFITPRGFASLIASCFGWLLDRLKREPATESSSMPLAVPPPATDFTPRKFGAEEEIKPTVFPKFKSDPKSRPLQPVYGSKRWLWNRLHPEADSAESVAISDAVPPLVVDEAASVADDGPVAAVSAGTRGALPDTETEAVEPATAAESATGTGKASQPAQTGESKKDLKQAAQEVWKKYGEAADQITADGWKLAPIEILDNVPEVEFSQADNTKKAKLIEDALASYGVESKVVQINVGPTVTQFGVEPGWDRKTKEIREKDKNGDIQIKIEEVAKTRVKVDRITSLSNDLSLALAAPSIRIEAPVPGKSIVGIEVPNTIIGTVSLRSVVESNTFQKMQAKAMMTMALGKGAGGESVVGDLTKMPHLLIAGATGSGKTVCIHSIICCLLLHNSPSDVKFIMIDPKRVELTTYNSLPHLATPVIVDTTKALGALRWLAQEMDKRYQIMATARARNIDAYNKDRPNEKLPYIVLVIDELADLMMTAGDEVEHILCRLAQLARATGIHLIVATQRPSVDVVTGLIKANFPSRISFAVTSQVDSRTILDSAGAEKLLGRGDMLYSPTEAAKPKRLQGCFLSDQEIERIVYFWNNQKKETASQLKLDDIVAAEVAKAEKGPEDPLLVEARKLLDQHDHISASFLQRHLRIGYPRAARLMEQLEDEMGEGIAELEDIKDEDEEEEKPPKLD